MRSGLRLAAVLLVVTACTSGTPGPPTTTAALPASGSSALQSIPQVAEIHCAGNRPQVLTRVVVAQADGVHFSIHNDGFRPVVFEPSWGPRRRPAGVELASHGDNRVAANAVEEMVWTVPPGATPVVCISAGHSPETANVATLEVLDPGRLFFLIVPSPPCSTLFPYTTLADPELHPS